MNMANVFTNACISTARSQKWLQPPWVRLLRLLLLHVASSSEKSPAGLPIRWLTASQFRLTFGADAWIHASHLRHGLQFPKRYNLCPSCEDVCVCICAFKTKTLSSTRQWGTNQSWIGSLARVERSVRSLAFSPARNTAQLCVVKNHQISSKWLAMARQNYLWY